MASTKEKLQRAKQLIQAKRYEDARAILRTIDHPKAWEWLDKIEKVAPAQQPQQVVTQVIVEKEKKKGGGCTRLGSIALLSLICIISLLMFMDDPETYSPSSSVQGNSRNNPYLAGSTQEIRDGRLKINRIQYNADSTVERMNMFNPEAESGQEWVIVSITFACDLPSDSTCNTTVMQFELVGDSGAVYQYEMFAVLDNQFQGEIFGGGQNTGNVGFIVSRSEDNLVFAVNDLGRRAFFALPE